MIRAVFFGLGSDGTVGANKSSVKIVGERTGLFSQGYFVYDSKKSGSRTVSHLRFSPEPIDSTYLIGEAGFVACHQFGLLDQVAVVETAAQGATLLLNSPFGPDEVWGQIPGEVQRQIIDKELDLWVIDAHAVAREAGLGGRVNTVLQTCFFALSGLLPVEEAIFAIKAEVLKAYGKRGEVVVRRNELAIDRALAALHRVEVPASPSRTDRAGRRLPDVGSRLRPPGDGDDDGRAGRSAPGLGAAGGRDLSHRHRAMGAAVDRPRDPDMGPGDLHRLRQVRPGVPARRDQDQGLRPRRGRRRSRGLRHQGDDRAATSRGSCSPSR